MIQKIREKQKNHLLGIFGGVLNDLNLTKSDAQIAVNNGGDLKSELSKTTRNFLRTVLWQGNVYPKDYRRKPVARQIDIVGKVFDLPTEKAMQFATERLPKIKFPQHAEGWFAIPSVEAVAAKHFPQVTGIVDQYRECVRFACAKIKETRKFNDYELGYFDHHPFMERPKSLEIYNSWANGGQSGEILIIPAQLGMRFQGKSVEDAFKTFSKKEFPLGMFEVLSILITHPKRFNPYAGLSIVCADNAILSDSGPEYPHFWMDTNESSIGDRISFQCRTRVHETKPYFGIASSFQF